MTIRTTITKVATEPKGSIGRTWRVDGVTMFKPGLEEAEVQLTSVGAVPSIELLTAAHEFGHVATAQDMADAYGNEEGFETLRESDIWTLEIEAWLRGFEENAPGRLSYTPMTFVLDCLNSYRRAHHVTEGEWDAMLDTMANYYDGDPQDLYDYEPLEPDPGEEPPDCTQNWGDPAPKPADDDGDEEYEDEDDEPGPDGSEEEPDDGYDDDEYEDGDDEGDDEGEPAEGRDMKPYAYDRSWLDQEVVDYALDNGLLAAARKYNLDPSTAPPLLQAI